MARAKDPDKRQAILDAAVQAIAADGLGASTAKISRAAGIAEGTLFTYFASKDDLLNALYAELKSEVFQRINEGFPTGATLRERTRHIWIAYLGWAMERPDDRKVSLLLHNAHQVSPATREQIESVRGAVAHTMHELGRHGSFQSLPEGFTSLAMMAMQEAVLDMLATRRTGKRTVIEQGFRAFWRMAE